MKQNITKSDWDELNDEQKLKFWDSFGYIKSIEDEKLSNKMIYSIGIGDLIEFLGDDWLVRLTWLEKYEDHNSSNQKINNMHLPVNEELVSQLWSAVKHKLKSE